MKKVKNIEWTKLLLIITLLMSNISAFSADYAINSLKTHSTTYSKTLGDQEYVKNTYYPTSASVGDYEFFCADDKCGVASDKVIIDGTEYSGCTRFKADRGLGFKVIGGKEVTIRVYYFSNDKPIPKLSISDSSDNYKFNRLAANLFNGDNAADCGTNSACLSYTFFPTETQVLWLSGSDDNKESRVALFEIFYPTTLVPINENYTWTGTLGETIGAGDLFGRGYFQNGSVAKEANQWNNINLNGNSYPTFDYTKNGDITTKVDADMHGTINVYYNDDAANMSYITENFTSPHPTSSAGSATGKVLTFNYAGDGNKPALGYVIDSQDKTYTNSRFTASITCNDGLQVILKVVYYDNGSLTEVMSSSSDLNVAIPEGKKIYGFYVEAVIDGQEAFSKTCTVNWARIEEHYVSDAVIKNGANTVSVTPTTVDSRTKKVSYKFSTTEETTLTISGGNIGAIEVTGVHKNEEISTIDNAITSDYIWYANGTLAANSYTDVNDSEFTYHKGDELAQSTTDRIGVLNSWGNNRPFGYILADGQTIGFKVSTDKPCEINFYYHEDATFNVYNCDKISDISSKSPKKPSYTNIMKDGTVMATIKVDKKSGKTQTYWIQGEGLFGGFEVLFDDETTGTINRLTYSADNRGKKFDCGQIKKQHTPRTNALGSTTEYLYMPSSDSWLYGPSRMFNPCNMNSAPINKGKGIGFKLPTNTTMQLTVNYYGQSNATLRLVKGSDTAPSNASADRLAEFSGNTTGFKQKDSEVLSASMIITTDSSDPVYWVTGSDNNLAYIQSIYISTDILLPISENHIYYIGNPTTLTNKGLYDGNLLRYMGAEVTADSDTKIKVPSGANADNLNNETPTNVVTSTTSIEGQQAGDYYGIRIAKGYKGYIKVYYKAEERANATIAKGTYDLAVADGYYPITSRISTKTEGGTVIMTMPFDYTASDVSQLYWISGNMKLGAIKVIIDESAPEEPNTGDGSHGFVYIKTDTSEPAFPYEARTGITYDDQEGTGLVTIKNPATDATNKTMTFMMGTKGVYIRRSNSKDGNKQMFLKGGVKWSGQRVAGNQGGFLDNIRTSYAGNNVDWSSDYHLSYTPDQYEINANPQTECNSGLGGITTENGGMFLQPVSGDFFRMEPEYDGVVTLYILQNGNTDGKTSQTGQLTRRPVYVMDENGKIMKRSTVKPSFDFTTKSQYAVDGTWMDINSWAPIRSDYEEAWAKAKELWSEGTLDARYQETMRFYDFWYDGGTYDFDNPDDKVTLKDWEVTTTKSGNTYTYGSATELTLKDEIGLPYYRNDKLWELENNSTNNLLVSGQNDFAKYGYEVPVHIHVRYVFPVRAGKSYYIGGRGTKNDFMAVMFQPMPANYNSADYIQAGFNYRVNENTNTGKYELTNISTSGSKGVIDYATDYTTSYTGTGYPTMTLSGVSNSTALSWDNEKKTVNFTLTGRKFYAGRWYPIVLPFSVSESKLREKFGNGVQVLYLDPYNHSLDQQSIGTKGQDGYEYWISAINPAVKGNKLRFTYHYYQMLYANTPAFICPSDDVTNDITFERVHLEKANLDSDGNIGYKIGEAGAYDYYVVGSYVSTSSTDNKEMYYLDNVNGKATMYHSQTGVDMKPTRCWIAIKDRSSNTFCSPGRETLISEIDFATYDGTLIEGMNEESGIQDIVMDDTTVDMYNDDNVYDMMGRIVGYGSTDGLKPGVYIYHGRKTYIR